MKTRIKLKQTVKTTLLLVLMAFNPILGFAQEDTQAFAFTAKWSPGDTFVFEITEEMEEWRGNDLIQDDTSYYYADMIILDSTGVGYRISWQYINDLSAYGINEDQWDQFNFFRYQEVICTLDVNGAFLGIENLEELRKETMAVIKASFQEKLRTKKIDQKRYDESIETIEKFYTGEYSTSLLQDDFIMAIHQHLGRPYPLNKKTSSRHWSINPFGGDPIPSETMSLMSHPNKPGQQMRLVVKSQLTSDAVDKIIQGMLDKMDIAESDLEQELSGMDFRIDQKIIYDFNCEVSIADEIVSTNETNVKAKDLVIEKFEGMRIKLIQFIPKDVSQ